MPFKCLCFDRRDLALRKLQLMHDFHLTFLFLIALSTQYTHASTRGDTPPPKALWKKVLFKFLCMRMNLDHGIVFGYEYIYTIRFRKWNAINHEISRSFFEWRPYYNIHWTCHLVIYFYNMHENTLQYLLFQTCKARLLQVDCKDNNFSYGYYRFASSSYIRIRSTFFDFNPQLLWTSLENLKVINTCLHKQYNLDFLAC